MNGTINEVTNENGITLSVGDACKNEVGQEFMPIKRFFIKEELIYAQFNEGYESNDGSLPINALILHLKSKGGDNKSKLLNSAAEEISRLRGINEVLYAKVETFESVMLLLKTAPFSTSQTYSEDIVWKIQGELEGQKRKG